MKITNVRGNVYKIEEMTEGKLLSLYWALDDKRKAHNGYLGRLRLLATTNSLLRR